MSDQPEPEKMELDTTELGFAFPGIHTGPAGSSDEQAVAGVTNPPPPLDHRLYIPDIQRWGVNVKRTSENEYCYTANPGEDYFHLLLDGELYVQRGYEKYCLNCAMRQGIITSDRLYWQRRGGKPLTD